MTARDQPQRRGTRRIGRVGPRQPVGETRIGAPGMQHALQRRDLIGALVAGIDAGRGYTDWPLMAGQFFPPEAFTLSPLWTNFFENPGLVQFIHRVAGYGLLAFGLAVWLRARRAPNPSTARAFGLVAAMLVVQMAIGIATVLHAAAPPVAIVHQFGAVVLWVLILRARHFAAYPLPQSIARPA